MLDRLGTVLPRIIAALAQTADNEVVFFAKFDINTAIFFPPKCQLRIVRKPFLDFFVNRQLKEVSNRVNKHLYDPSISSKVHDQHSI